jgi:hypothetical protein
MLAMFSFSLGDLNPLRARVVLRVRVKPMRGTANAAIVLIRNVRRDTIVHSPLHEHIYLLKISPFQVER